MEYFPPMLFTGIRFALLSVVLAGFIAVPRHLIRPLLKISLFMGVGMYLTLYIALSIADNTASIAVFSKLEVPFAILLGILLLKEKIGPRRIAGITLAMLGALLISFEPTALDDLPAIFWMALSCLFSAYSMILVRRLGKVHPLTITAWISIVSAPVLLMASLVFENDQISYIQQANFTGWFALCYTAFMSSIIAHSGMYYLLQRYPVGHVSAFGLLSSVFAVIGGVALLDDKLTLTLIVGGLMILSGVAWINARVNAASRPSAVSE